MSLVKKNYVGVGEEIQEPTNEQYRVLVYCTNCGHGLSDCFLFVIANKGADYKGEKCPNCDMSGKLAVRMS